MNAEALTHIIGRFEVAGINEGNTQLFARFEGANGHKEILLTDLRGEVGLNEANKIIGVDGIHIQVDGG